MAPAYLRRRIARAGAPYTFDGTTTFAYVGDADDVKVTHFMARFPSFPPMERLDGTELWHVTVELPEGARVEYKLEVIGDHGTDRILDPLNRRTASDPFGSNSVAHAPGYVEPAWVAPDPEVPPGTLTTFPVEGSAFGDDRLVGLYLPPGHPEDGPYPVVVLHDGSDMVEYASLTIVLDNLIAAGAMRPAVVALLDPVHRNREYTASEDHARFVVDDVLSRLVDRFDAVRPARRPRDRRQQPGGGGQPGDGVAPPGDVRIGAAPLRVVRHRHRRPAAAGAAVRAGDRLHEDLRRRSGNTRRAGLDGGGDLRGPGRRQPGVPTRARSRRDRRLLRGGGRRPPLAELAQLAR